MRERRTRSRDSSWLPRLPRRRSEHGAVAVEAAIITPLFILLVFGIIEFGLVFKDYLGVTSSVRAGARIASAEPRNSDFATDAAGQVAREGSALDMKKVEELWVYKAGTNGYPIGHSDFEHGCSSCVKFTWNNSEDQFDPSSGSPGWDSSTQNACPGHEESVGVYLKYDHPSLTHLVMDSMHLKSYTVMSLEPLPQTAPCSL